MTPARIEELAQNATAECAEMEAWGGRPKPVIAEAISTAVREALDAAADICEPGNDCADLLTYSEAIRRLRDELAP